MATSSSQQFEQAWGKIVAQSWETPTFRAEVEKDPKKALAAAGVALPAEVNVVIRNQTGELQKAGTTITLDLPDLPANYSKLSPAEVKTKLATICSSSIFTCCCP